MENRKKLHESGVVMIIVGIYNLLMFALTMIESVLDGDLAEALDKVDSDILVAAKVGIVIVCVITAFFVAADIFLGIKAIKVSKNPTASRAYIIIAFIFCILSAIAVIINAISVFSGNGSVTGSGVNMGTTAFGVCIYAWFINNAEAVRKDFLNGTKE